jgi:hypothetical protein
MNRYIQFLCLAVLLAGTCTAQVGIGTANPVGILNVDILKDNPLPPTLSGSELKDDLIFRLNTNNEANLVIGGAPLNKEASLELNDPEKALLLNRVALQRILDAITVPSPRDGMIVYNTNTSDINGTGPGTSEGDVIPGTYLHMDDEWLRLVDNVGGGTSTASKIGSLISYMPNGTPGASASASEVADKMTGAGAFSLPLNQSVIIDNPGRYVFSFRLYGQMSNSGSIVTGQVCDDYYLYLFKKANGSSTEVLLSRIDMVVSKGSSNSGFATYFPVIQTPYLSSGDEVIIKIGRRPGATDWQLYGGANVNNANRTTFVYWKIL